MSLVVCLMDSAGMVDAGVVTKLTPCLVDSRGMTFSTERQGDGLELRS